ncbi:unnamed protein product [Prunus brigantina]
MERLRYNNWLEMEEGELTHPPRTLILIIVDVPAFVPDIERLVYVYISNVVACVAECVRLVYVYTFW